MGSSLSKLALSAGSMAGRRGAVEYGLVEGGSANYYLFVVQTNSEMDATHYSFVVHTTIGL